MCKEENHTLKQKLSQEQDVLGQQVYNLQIQLKEKAAEIEAIHDQVEEKEKNLAYVQLVSLYLHSYDLILNYTYVCCL